MEPKVMGYSLDLSKKVINYVNKGNSREEASKILGLELGLYIDGLQDLKLVV